MLIQFKFYEKQKEAPYYKFSWKIFLWNKFVVKTAIRYHNLTAKLFGTIKFYWLTLLVYLRLREPIEDWEIMDYNE